MPEGDVVLLVGDPAVDLSPRLEASGYQPRHWDAGVSGSAVNGATPVIAILATDQAHRIADLRARFGAIPVLLDVHVDSVEGREVCLDAGANDFWLSSLGISDLLQRLRLHLSIQRRQDQVSAVLRVGDLTVDPSCRQVRRGTRPLALTAREYALLMLLLSRAGQVVSRDQILSEVWNDERGASSNVIEVYVRYLRQKLEEKGEPRLLHTIRGRGYSLSDDVPTR